LKSAVAFARQSVGQAIDTLHKQLAKAGSLIQADRVYVVQLDTKRLNPGAMEGRTFVLRGNADGGVTHLGTFRSSSQPSAFHHNESWFYNTRTYGPAFINEGMWTLTRKKDASYGEYGGSFRIPGDVPSFRFGGLIPGKNHQKADGILLHEADLGSAGCQRIENFRAFRDLVLAQRGHPDFDYILARV
jgi:hypothetical protein